MGWRVWIETDKDQVDAHMDEAIKGTDPRPTPPGGRTRSWTALPNGATLIEERDGS